MKIAAIGGGTGLSTMLRGLKRISPSITAIVTVMDNGGGSGVLRQELGMLPPGDIRNCLQALANTEPTMEALLAYRFQDGALRGQSFGNLFLAALNGMCDTFDEAVTRMSEVLAITGRVLPVTNENVQLLADFDDGVTVTGESQIAEYKKDLTRRIVRAYLSPEHPAALPACLDAIREADLIVLGPGSLYTSVIPNLLVSGIREAIHESDAVKVYVMNLMTQSGETAGYTAVDHVRALFDHGGEGLFDYTLVNDLPIPPEAQEEYLREGAVPITADEEALAALGVTVRYAPVALWQKALVRHDPAALAAALERTGSLLDKSVCVALPDTETVCGTASAGADAAIWFFAPGLEEKDAEVFRDAVLAALRSAAGGGFSDPAVETLSAAQRLEELTFPERDDLGAALCEGFAAAWAQGDASGYPAQLRARWNAAAYLADGSCAEAVREELLESTRTALVTVVSEPAREPEPTPEAIPEPTEEAAPT